MVCVCVCVCACVCRDVNNKNWVFVCVVLCVCVVYDINVYVLSMYVSVPFMPATLHTFSLLSLPHCYVCYVSCVYICMCYFTMQS